MNTGTMTSIARPYAQAAFEYATAKNAVASWETMLNGAAVLAQNKLMLELLSSPEVTQNQLADIFFDVLKSELDTEKKNFIHLLAEYKRLAVLPDIAALFTQYRQAQEKTVSVEVVSATPLDEKYKQKLSKALHQRLQRQIDLQCKTEKDLLGGIMIRAGDMVIDGTVRGKLIRLLDSL